MPTTPTLLLPYPSPPDPADVPLDMQELCDRLELVRGAANGYASLGADGKVPASQLPPVVGATYGTTFPPAPADGALHVLVDSITGATFAWQFRYNAGSASAYKWEFVGGTLGYSVINTQEGVAANAGYVDAATVGPQFTLPVAGDYVIAWGFGGAAQLGGSYNSNMDGQLWNAAVAALGGQVLSFGSQGSIPQMYTSERYAAQPAGRVIRMRYSNGISGGAAGVVKNRSMSVHPLRAG